MSFKQKSSPLRQGLIPERIVNNGMTAAQIAYSNTPAGQIPTAPIANQVLPITSSIVPTTSPITPTTPTNTVRQRGRNFFGAAPTNTVDGGPQSVMQGGHGTGFTRRDSHNTSFVDRTNRGNRTLTNNPSNRSNMFSPFPQLKKEQMEYNKISTKAFSNSGTIEKMMGKSVPNSPFMQMADPNIMAQTPGVMDASVQAEAENVMAQTGVPLQPPTGVQTPITPTYDINNY
jgi:hypothetical protein